MKMKDVVTSCRYGLRSASEKVVCCWLDEEVVGVLNVLWSVVLRGRDVEVRQRRKFCETRLV